MSLQKIRIRVRSGLFTASDFGEARQICSSAEKDSFEYIAATSLAAEIAEQRGDYAASAAIVAPLGSDLLTGFKQTPIIQRMQDNRTSIELYKRVRQEIWCVLAFCQSLYHSRRSADAARELRILNDQIQDALNSVAWPRNLQFHGTRARLFYYLGLNLRTDREHAAEALKHFDAVAFHVGERLASQHQAHAGDEHRLSIESRYAMDCLAKMMIFGYAWTHIANARIGAASSILSIAEALIKSSANPYAKTTIDLLRLQIQRHQTGDGEALSSSYARLSALCEKLREHPVNWARAQFELGLHLVHLLRFQQSIHCDAAANSRLLLETIERLRDLSKPGGIVTNADERIFQAEWVAAFACDLAGRYSDALTHLDRANRSLDVLRARSDGNLGFWPLQYSEGQSPILEARLRIRAGEPGRAFANLCDSRAAWYAGPNWLKLLGLLRCCQAACGISSLDEAASFYKEAEQFLPKCEVRWIVQEAMETQEILKEAQAKLVALQRQYVGTLAPGETIRNLMQHFLASELQRQRQEHASLSREAQVWRPTEAAQNLEITRHELKSWLLLAGMEVANAGGRPAGHKRGFRHQGAAPDPDSRPEGDADSRQGP